MNVDDIIFAKITSEGATITGICYICGEFKWDAVIAPEGTGLYDDLTCTVEYQNEQAMLKAFFSRINKVMAIPPSTAIAGWKIKASWSLLVRNAMRYDIPVDSALKINPFDRFSKVDALIDLTNIYKQCQYTLDDDSIPEADEWLNELGISCTGIHAYFAELTALRRMLSDYYIAPEI